MISEHQLRTIAIARVQEDYPTRYVGVAAWEAGLYEPWTKQDYETAYWIWEQAVKDWEAKLVEYLLNLPFGVAGSGDVRAKS